MNVSNYFLRSLLLLASTTSSCNERHGLIMHRIKKALLFVLNLVISTSASKFLCYENSDSSVVPRSPSSYHWRFYRVLSHPLSVKSLQAEESSVIQSLLLQNLSILEPVCHVGFACSAPSSRWWAAEAMPGTEGAVPQHSAVSGLLAVPFLLLYLPSY